MEIKTFGKVKKGLAILLAVLFVVSITAAAASACGADNSYKSKCTSCAKDNGSCKDKCTSCAKDNGSCKNAPVRMTPVRTNTTTVKNAHHVTNIRSTTSIVNVARAESAVLADNY